MKFEAKFEVLQLADLVTPPYNPRVDMEPDSPEYKALRRSLEQHQLVEPPVVNLHNMRCIGGNQRVVVMLALGMTEVLCSVIDQPDESKEKKLCLALNRVDGRWDTDKLGDLLRDDDVLEYETGFDAEEVRVYRLLEDARSRTMTATIPAMTRRTMSRSRRTMSRRRMRATPGRAMRSRASAAPSSRSAT